MFVGVDFIQAVGNFISLESFERFLSEITIFNSDKYSIDSSRAFHAFQSYSNSFKSVFGFKGGFNFVASGLRVLLIIPGQWLRTLNIKAQYDILKFLSNHLKFTRLDIYFDDYEKLISFKQLKSHAEAGNYAIFQCHKYIQSTVDHSGNISPTIYFGSSKSNKLLRIYDCNGVHSKNATRWELQLRRELAEVTVSYLCSEEVIFEQTILNIICSSIEFINRKENNKRFRWWQKFLDISTEKLQITYTPEPADLLKKFDWIDRQVAPSLFILYQGLGPIQFQNYLSSLFNRCQQADRIKAHHLNQISILQRENNYGTSSISCSKG